MDMGLNTLIELLQVCISMELEFEYQDSPNRKDLRNIVVLYFTTFLS